MRKAAARATWAVTQVKARQPHRSGRLPCSRSADVGVLSRGRARQLPAYYHLESVTSYRDIAEPGLALDPEAVAIATLGTRARRLRGTVHVVVLLTGLAAAVALYFGLREFFFSVFHAHSPWVTGLLSIAPALRLTLRVAPWAANGLANRMLPTWRKELATRHGLDAALLEETTQFI